MIPYITVRIARIISSDRTTGRCTIVYTDDNGTQFTTQAILPQPLAAGESGVFVEPAEGAQVLVDLGIMNQPYIISYLPDLQFDQLITLNNSLSLKNSFLPRPKGEPGEVTIKGFGNTYTRYSQDGNIETRFGTSRATFDADDIYSLLADSQLVSLESGYSVSGTIKRELSGPSSDLLDKLTDPQFEDSLSEIARNPSLPSALKTSPDPNSSIAKRNPPFVEQRNVVYEFARSYSAGSPQYEAQLYKNSTDSLYDLAEERQGTRTDALGLSPLQHNVLFESILGTVVDLYGNILDLNRFPIAVSSLVSENDVEELYQLMRRTIKLHVELNSRKADKADVSLGSTAGSYPEAQKTISQHSRWFVDVDAEGQTKVNIPSSSPVGNIPVSARYIPTAYYEIEQETDRTKYDVRLNSDGKAAADISLLNYNLSKAGVPILNAPDSRGQKFTWNMPYHDFTFSDILDRRQYFYPGAILGEPLEIARDALYAERLAGIGAQNAVPTKILTAELLSNSVNANAGGRSLHANLDGSAEISFGADQADGKSICLDTSGSAILRLGKDKRDRSLVIGADGDCVLMVGASRKAEDSEDISGGNLQIFVEGSSGVASIQIVDGNVVVKGAPNKNVIIESAGNLVLNAGKDLLLGGERVFLFGKYAEDGVSLAGEREILRSGNKVI